MMWKDSTDKINDKYISVGPDMFQIRHYAYKLPPFLITLTQQCQHCVKLNHAKNAHTKQTETMDLVLKTGISKAK